MADTKLPERSRYDLDGPPEDTIRIIEQVVRRSVAELVASMEYPQPKNVRITFVRPRYPLSEFKVDICTQKDTHIRYTFDGSEFVKWKDRSNSSCEWSSENLRVEVRRIISFLLFSEYYPANEHVLLGFDASEILPKQKPGIAALDLQSYFDWEKQDGRSGNTIERFFDPLVDEARKGYLRLVSNRIDEMEHGGDWLMHM